MEKSPDAFRTISEVAEWLGVQTHVLRFWESKFTQVKPVKRAGGRRYYRPTDMQLLGGIKRLLHDDGMTIKGVQKLLREEGVGHVSKFSQPLDSSIESGEEAVSENVVRFTARAEDVAAAETEIVSAPQPTEPAPAAPMVEEAKAEPETEKTPEFAATSRTPEVEVIPPTPAEVESEASPLPSFLTNTMSETSEPAKPRIVHAPDPVPDNELHAEPGVLQHLIDVGSVDAETARALTPLVARLAVLRDRLSAPIG